MKAAPLQRQILMVLAAALVSSAVLSEVASLLLAPPHHREERSARRLAPVLLTSFDLVFDDAPARERLVASLAALTARRVEMIDDRGEVLAASGPGG